MNLKYVFFALLIYLYCQINQCYSKKISYFSTERPAINWFDTRYFKNLTMISRRLGRQDPRYYVEVYVHNLFPMDNNMKMDFYFFQFLTNRYRPSFVEMHFGFCDMVHFDAIFGQTIRKALGNQDCPLPVGIYDMKNLTIPYVPTGFPFNKGRIYCNISLAEGGSTKLVAWGSIDMEVKVAKINT